jgi:hypothetical protein
VDARFSAPVQTGPGTHPVSCAMGTKSFPGVESVRGVTLTPHPLLMPRSKKQSRAIPLLSLRAFVDYNKGETYLPRQGEQCHVTMGRVRLTVPETEMQQCVLCAFLISMSLSKIINRMIVAQK